MGRGLLVVSHDEGGLDQIADRRYELEDARLIPS
jgi:ATPase subunit of ABC transporter with duplicated ATPase domains